MKAKFKGLLALWMTAILVVTMMLPIGAVQNQKYIHIYTGEDALTEYSTTPSEDLFEHKEAQEGDHLSDVYDVPNGKELVGWKKWERTEYGNVYGNIINAEELEKDAIIESDWLDDDTYVMGYDCYIFEPLLEDASNQGSSGVSLFAILLMMRNVKFYDGDIQLERVNVFRGKTIEEPEAPVKDGMIFDGWYTDAEFTEKFDFETKITDFLKLYAKWIPAAE